MSEELDVAVDLVSKIRREASQQEVRYIREARLNRVSCKAYWCNSIRVAMTSVDCSV
jgi:hypothetical protein